MGNSTNTDDRFDKTCSFGSWQDIVGKTIKDINTATAANLIYITFSDDTYIYIEAEPIGLGLYTPVITTRNF
jgi:hypothetical protein